MAKQGPQMQRRHDDNRRNRRANDKTRLADCRARLVEVERENEELRATAETFKYAAQARIAGGELKIVFNDRASTGGPLLPLSSVRQLESAAFEAGAETALASMREFDERWQPVSQHTYNILAIAAGIRGVLLFSDLRADQHAVNAHMSAQAVLLAAHNTALRNVWATLIPHIELDTLPLQQLVNNIQDGITAFLAGDSGPLRALFDTSDWQHVVEVTLAAAGRGPGPQAGSLRLHSAWLQQQVRQLDAQYGNWSAGQMVIHLRGRLLADLRRDGVLPATQQAALDTLNGTTATNTISRIRRKLRALAKQGNA